MLKIQKLHFLQKKLLATLRCTHCKKWYICAEKYRHRTQHPAPQTPEKQFFQKKMHFFTKIMLQICHSYVYPIEERKNPHEQRHPTHRIHPPAH